MSKKSNKTNSLNNKNRFQRFLRCHICDTLNREIARFCKNCGSEIDQKTYSEEDILRISEEEIFKSRPLSQNQKEYTVEFLNKWINSIPHHPHRDLFKECEIRTAILIPWYSIKITLSNEKRKLEKKVVPYSGFDYPQGEIDISSYSVWNEKNISIYKDFNSHSYHYDIPGTFKVFSCQICSGSGWVICTSCSGSGNIVCSSCYGRGVDRCSRCDGKGRLECTNWSCKNGRVRCSTCDGKGYTEEYYGSRTIRKPCSSCGGVGTEICSTCNGAGTIICSTCDGRGLITCSRCDGSGRITCNICNGRGKITCSRCRGEGRLIENLYIDISYSNKVIKTDTSEFYPNGIFEKSPYIYGKPFSEIEPKNVLTVESDTYFSLNLKTSYLEFLDKYSKIIKQRDSEIKNNISKHSGERVVAERFEILRVNIIKIDYSYKNKDYTVYLFSPEMEDFSIYSPIDPVVEFNLSLSEQIIKDIENEKTDEAIYKFEIINQTSKDIKKLKDLAIPLFKLLNKNKSDYNESLNKISNLIVDEKLLVIFLCEFYGIMKEKLETLFKESREEWYCFFTKLNKDIIDVLSSKKCKKECYSAFNLLSSLLSYSNDALTDLWNKGEYKIAINLVEHIAEITGYFPENFSKLKPSHSEVIKKQRKYIDIYLATASTILFFYPLFHAISYKTKLTYSFSSIVFFISFYLFLSSFIYMIIPFNKKQFILISILLFLISGLYIYLVPLKIFYIGTGLTTFIISSILTAIYFLFRYLSFKRTKKRIERIKDIMRKSNIADLSKNSIELNLKSIYFSKKVNKELLSEYKELYQKMKETGVYDFKIPEKNFDDKTIKLILEVIRIPIPETSDALVFSKEEENIRIRISRNLLTEKHHADFIADILDALIEKENSNLKKEQG